MTQIKEVEQSVVSNCQPLGKQNSVAYLEILCQTKVHPSNCCCHCYVGSSSDAMDDDDDIYQKRKKARTAFSREQVAELEKKFQDKKYLSSNERGELAEKLKLSDMQVKTWFQNRRMKFKRQSEEAEMEMKASKYSFSSFMPYGNMMYSYMPNGSAYGYPGSIRSPQTPSSSLDSTFSQLDMSSPSMLSGLSTPLSAGPHRHTAGGSMTSPLIRSAPPTTSYFANGGLLTPLSPSSSYQQVYYNGESGSAHSGLGAYPQIPFVGHEWQRPISTPPVTTP